MIGEMRWGSWLKQGTILVSIMALVSGCFGSKPVLEELGKDGRGKLKVLYSNEGDFFENTEMYLRSNFRISTSKWSRPMDYTSRCKSKKVLIMGRY